MKWFAVSGLALMSFFLAEGSLPAREETAANAESVLVYPSIVVAVNRSVVIRLAKKVTRAAVTQPQVAEVVVVAPDQLVINGKAVGSTSLVVWFEKATARKKYV
ncbi:MAG TPA: pilus assembly protein N-terminal domain-containing protein [Candidatus Udaeobacter sp.]|jgi:pilus assembly protein CpaC|nr:pilus assembly protein N-terminal domain-containing protein [Candidatus Udaeobacter sp.]